MARPLLPLLARALSAVVLGAAAAGQGTDTCSSPTAISGLGTFAFTTGTTGSEGQANSACNYFGSTAIGRDVWFRWTSGTSGSVTLSTCSLTSVDTKVAVYAGTACPSGAPLACADDACGLQTSLSFTAVSGSTYVIQLGTYPGAAGGSGQFTLSATVPCSNATGPDVIVGDLTGPSNYNPTGALDAISLGTVSCNMGDVWLNWISSTNQHPVISGNLYRFRTVAGAGRFEQVPRRIQLLHAERLQPDQRLAGLLGALTWAAARRAAERGAG